jgi:hypothetical protein
MPALIYKRDALGTVFLDAQCTPPVVVRDTSAAGRFARPLARHLARREAAALSAASGIGGVPRLLGFDGRVLRRSHIDGVPMYEAAPRARGYFKLALRLLRRLHARGITHNDVAKEANWLCTPDGRPALVDFQLAYAPRRRTKLFRVLAREDLRHLLKHKRYYLPEALTARQRALLDRPTPFARAWRRLFKPPYRWVTRRVLGWPERSGPQERQARR